MDHQPTFTQSKFGSTTLLWFWSCTCGTQSVPKGFTSDGEVLHSYYTHHPDAPMPPDHDFVQIEGGFGGPAWECTCGERSRPEGYLDERRCRQSHSRHRTEAMRVWESAFKTWQRDHDDAAERAWLASMPIAERRAHRAQQRRDEARERSVRGYRGSVLDEAGLL